SCPAPRRRPCPAPAATRPPAAPVAGDQATDSRRRDPQDIADAPDGMDQPWLAVVNLAPEVTNVGLNDIAIAVEAVLPHMIEDLGLAQHPPGVDHQVAEQLELVR